MWTGGTDLGPVNNPDAHPTRVRFHSKKENIGFHAQPHTGSVSVTNWEERFVGAPRARRRNLFAHGLDYRPLLLGFLTIGSRDLPIQGTIVHRHSSGEFFGYTVGADDQHVFLNQLRFRPGSSAGSTQSTSISYTIWVAAYGAKSDNTVRRPPFFNGCIITDEYVKAGYFDTEQFRYPFQASGGAIPFIRGRSISLGVGYCGTSASEPYRLEASGLGWRYSVDGYVSQRNATAVSTTVTGNLPGNNASFNASVVKLSI